MNSIFPTTNKLTYVDMNFHKIRHSLPIPKTWTIKTLAKDPMFIFLDILSTILLSQCYLLCKRIVTIHVSVTIFKWIPCKKTERNCSFECRLLR